MTSSTLQQLPAMRHFGGQQQPPSLQTTRASSLTARGSGGHPQRVSEGCKQPTPNQRGHSPPLPLGLPSAPLQKQQPAATANRCKIASLHFRVLLSFALVAGKSILQGIITTLPWPRSLDFWPLSLAHLLAGLEVPPSPPKAPSPSSHACLASSRFSHARHRRLYGSALCTEIPRSFRSQVASCRSSYLVEASSTIPGPA